jgi:hypothetical protein
MERFSQRRLFYFMILVSRNDVVFVKKDGSA